MTKRILVTGGGGAAAISFIRALGGSDYEFLIGDIDPYAAGLYLVPPRRRLLLPRGDSPDFAQRVLDLCLEHGVEVLVPTVDVELLPIARSRGAFEQEGIEILLASEETLASTLDKHRLMQACRGLVATPRSELFDEEFRADEWQFPVIVKPRTGSGSRGVKRIDDAAELDRHSRSSSLLVQEHLPGAEYSVDVLALPAREFFVAVPRERLKVDSGVAVAGRTVRDAELEESARLVAARIGLDFVANIQFRRNRGGRPALLEVNPRFPGTMPLTVAAGLNMPRLALEALLGEQPEPPLPEFREIAMVRTWGETFVSPDEVEALELDCA